MWNLIADVGGTNMRLAAVSSNGDMLDRNDYSSNGELTVPEACREFSARQTGGPQAVVVAAAGVVADGQVSLTNSKQTFSEADLAQACGCGHASILNDFEAAAWSLATVGADDVTTLQGDGDFPREPRLIIGPGTGLGVGALVWHGATPMVVPGEGGHVRLSPRNEAELSYFKALLADWPEVAMGPGAAIEAEAILSGTGLPRFCRAIATAKGLEAPLKDARAVLEAARAGSDPCAVEAAALFRDYLGAVAGDLGLVFAATGGVFIAGGVASANAWLFGDEFLQAFNAGGRHTEWRQKLPVHLYHNANFGLIGARNALMAG